jgi:hypothetical protein
MVARVAATSKHREKTEEPILAKKPKEIPPPYVPLHLSLPPAPSSTPSTPTWGSSRDNHTYKIWFGSLGDLDSDSSGLYGLYTHSKSSSGHPTFPTLLRASNQSSGGPLLSMPLREAQSPKYYDQEGHIQGRG